MHLYDMINIILIRVCNVRKPMEGLLSFLGPSVYKHITTRESMNRFSRNLIAGNFTKYCDIFLISFISEAFNNFT